MSTDNKNAKWYGRAMDSWGAETKKDQQESSWGQKDAKGEWAKSSVSLVACPVYGVASCDREQPLTIPTTPGIGHPIWYGDSHTPPHMMPPQGLVPETPTWPTYAEAKGKRRVGKAEWKLGRMPRLRGRVL